MKMTQPELGRKIAELRKARGLTQEELVEKCRLSVRTLQRIESGEVVPRSHTIKVIFEALEYEVFGNRTKTFGKPGSFLRELFNLKTHTMKKISVLTLAIAAAAILLLTVTPEGKAQGKKNAREYITGTSDDFMRWFNNGQTDSLLTLYADDACILTAGCGKHAIREFFESQMSLVQFTHMATTSVSVADSVAVEKGRWTVRLNEAMIRGEYMTEWRYRKGRWVIVFDISDNY